MKIWNSTRSAAPSVLKGAAIVAGLTAFLTGPALAASVGVTWKSKSNTANTVSKSFVERLAEIAPDVKVKVQGQVADNDALAKTVSDFDSTMDAVVVLRSHGAKFLKKNPTKKPGFFGGANNPAALGVIENLESPEGNVTGVSQAISHQTSLQAFMTILPSLSKPTILLQKGHPSSGVDKKGASAACAKLGLSCTFVEAATVGELTAAVGAVKGEDAAIVLGSQTLVNNSTKEIVAAAGNTPIFSFSSRPIKMGATAGLVADNKKLGRKLADMVIDAIRNGKAIKDLPVGFDDEPALMLNMKSVQKIGLNVPPEILNSATIIE